MQTFITDYDFAKSMQALDSQRLNKQLIESLQIAQYLTNTRLLNSFHPNAPHKNHPIVGMWRKNKSCFYHYMCANSTELINRGLAINSHMHDAVHVFGKLVKARKSVELPKWLNDDFINSHREALLYKSLLKKLTYQYSQEKQLPIRAVRNEVDFQKQYQHFFCILRLSSESNFKYYCFRKNVQYM